MLYARIFPLQRTRLHSKLNSTVWHLRISLISTSLENLSRNYSYYDANVDVLSESVESAHTLWSPNANDTVTISEMRKFNCARLLKWHTSIEKKNGSNKFASVEMRRQKNTKEIKNGAICWSRFCFKSNGVKEKNLYFLLQYVKMYFGHLAHILIRPIDFSRTSCAKWIAQNWVL